MMKKIWNFHKAFNENSKDSFIHDKTRVLRSTRLAHVSIEFKLF